MINQEQQQRGELKLLQPCNEGFQWAIAQPSLYDAWETCQDFAWMWWYLRRKNVSKEISVKYAKWLAERATIYANAAYAAADTTAYKEERAIQADFIRSLVPNPFIKPT